MCLAQNNQDTIPHREDTIMIASEPLTFEESDWMVVKTNTMIVVTPQVRSIRLPLIEHFFLTRQTDTEDEPLANTHHGEHMAISCPSFSTR
jgi:hypothetical protein